MPFGLKPICTVCKSGISTLWRKGSQGEVLCNTCGLKQLGKFIEVNSKTVTASSCAAVNIANGSTKLHNVKSLDQSTATRKSLRIKPSKHKLNSANKSLSSKGKGRRSIFKRNPIRSCTSVSTVVTSNSVFHNNQYYQKGDIVSLIDHSGDVYYGQIRGFLTDQFCNKSAVITWLLPTTSSPQSHFDISTYILGPEEEIPRKMDFMEFVCHCSSDYFKTQAAPYPTVSPKPDLCYIWTSVGGQIQDKPSTDEIFGCRDLLPT